MNTNICFKNSPLEYAAVLHQSVATHEAPSYSVQQISIDLKKPDLGLAPDLIRALAESNKYLKNPETQPEQAADVLVHWLNFFSKENVSKSDPSLFLLENKLMYYIDLSLREKSIDTTSWFFTNAHFISQYNNEIFKDPLRSIGFIKFLFEKLKNPFSQEGLKKHLNVLLENIFVFLSNEGKSFNAKTTLAVLGQLEQLSMNLYRDQHYLFQEFRASISQSFLNLTKTLLYCLENRLEPTSSSIESLLFLLEKVSCRSGSELEKLLPTVLSVLEAHQESFSEDKVGRAYAKVYGQFLKLYFDSNNKAYDLNQEKDKKRLLCLAFLTPGVKSSSVQEFTLSDLSKILDFEAVKALPSPEKQGKALGLFLNQFFRFIQSLKDPLGQESKIDSVFKTYFRNPNRIGYTEFSFIFLELSHQLDSYFKDLEKKTPSDLFEYAFSLIKAFGNTLEKNIYTLRLDQGNESIRSCADLILKFIEKKVLGFTSCPLLEADKKVKLLVNLVVLLRDNKENFRIEHPVAWMIESVTFRQIGDILSVYVRGPEGYKTHEHEISFELLQSIHPYLDRESSASLIEILEAKKDFFEMSSYKEKYQALYQDALISYFFHKMTHAQFYFTDYDEDVKRLEKVIIPLCEAFIKRVLTQEKLIYADNPLNGADMDVAKPPLLKDLQCKVILNQDGYFEVDSSFIEKLSLEPSIGSPLNLSDTDKTPIGYTAYIPETPRAILVEVYGGREKKEKKDAPQFSLPTFLDRGLLDQKIAVIKLNLPDLLELSVHQSQMPSDLYEKIQACIHTFYTALSAFPGSLHKELDTLKGLPIGLYGASFGGGLIFNQSILFPNSFSCYISHSGVLDSSQHFYDEKLKPKDPTINQRFSVVEQRSDLKDTYLVLHTANDPCVNIHCSLGFYQKPNIENKPVKLNIFPKGGRAVVEGSSKFTYTGHGVPVLKKSFNLYIQEIVSFLTKDKPINPLSSVISKWRAHTYGAYMDKYSYGRINNTKEQLGSIEKLVLSQLYLLYKNACLWRGKDVALAAPSDILDKAKEDSLWDTYYFPKYKAYRAAEYVLENEKTLKAFLVRQDLELIFEKAAERFLEEHVLHFEEILNMKVDKKALDISSLSKNIGLLFKESLNVAVYGQAVEAADCSYYNFSNKHLDFLAILFVECPDYIKNVFEDEKIKHIEEQSSKLKELFLTLIRQNRQLGERVIQQGVLSMHKEKRLEPLLESYRKSKKATL